MLVRSPLRSSVSITAVFNATPDTVTHLARLTRTTMILLSLTRRRRHTHTTLYIGTRSVGLYVGTPVGYHVGTTVGTVVGTSVGITGSLGPPVCTTPSHVRNHYYYYSSLLHIDTYTSCTTHIRSSTWDSHHHHLGHTSHHQHLQG